jgi:hypothetical protein
MAAPSQHFVTVCANISSHIRLHLQLALNLLKIHPSLGITVLHPASVTQVLEHELDIQPHASLDHVRRRLRVKSLDDAGEPSYWLDQLARYRKNLEPQIEGLLLGEDGWRIPGLFLADVCYFVAVDKRSLLTSVFSYLYANIRATLSNSLPTVAFLACPSFMSTPLSQSATIGM